MKLTPREQQIFVLLSQGKTYKQAGEYLGISINTIRTRVRIFYRKLNAHTIAEAVVNYELAKNGELPPGQRESVRQYWRPETK